MAEQTVEKMEKAKEKEKVKNGVQAPEGYQKVAASTFAPWAVKVPGAIIHGELVGRFKMSGSGKDRFYYQILLYEPCKATEKEDDDYNVIDMGPGEIISVDEVQQLTGLQTVITAVDSGKRRSVWIHFVSKKKISNARTQWEVDVRSSDRIQKVDPVDMMDH